MSYHVELHVNHILKYLVKEIGSYSRSLFIRTSDSKERTELGK